MNEDIKIDQTVTEDQFWERRVYLPVRDETLTEDEMWERRVYLPVKDD